MNHMRYLWNYFLSERSYYTRTLAPPNKPMVFSIETTSYCNLKCVMCPYKDMTRPHEMMEFEVFRKVIDEVRDYNGSIWLHNLGEPLAHPQFAELTRYVKDNGLPCGFSTNATLLNEARAMRVLESGLDRIILCMDGVTKETFEEIRVGASFEKVTRNIERFLRLKKEQGFEKPETIVQLIYMKGTESQVEDFKRRWRPLADRVHIKPFATWADQVEPITELSESKHRYYPEHSASNQRHPCAYLWRNVVVTAAGDVIPCCMDNDARMVMGNVKENSLQEIWHGEKFQQVRADQLAGRFTSACESCLEWIGGPANKTYPLGKPFVTKLVRAVQKTPENGRVEDTG